MSKVFDLYAQNGIVEHVKETAPYLEACLDRLVEKHPCLESRRGKGLMQGLVVKDLPVGQVVKGALDEGLIVLSAGSDVLRLVPPLVIEKEHIDEMADKLDKALAGK